MTIRHLELEAPVDVQELADAFVAVLELKDVYQRPEPVGNPIIIRGFLPGNPTMYFSRSRYMTPDLVWGKGYIDVSNDHIDIPEGWDESISEVLRPRTWKETVQQFLQGFTQGSFGMW